MSARVGRAADAGTGAENPVHFLTLPALESVGMEHQFALFDQAGNANRPVVDPRLPDEAKPRLTRQCAAVLERLKQGPATNMELIPLATRFSARLYELRKAGYIIETDQIDRSKGLTLYTLKGRK